MLFWIECGLGNVGGRICGVWVDFRDFIYRIWIVGFVGGGFWKMVDVGENWSIISDDFSNLSVIILVGSVVDFLVIYVGIGEGFNSCMVKGSGVWKSVDGGMIWSLLNFMILEIEFVNVMWIVVDFVDFDVVLVVMRVDLCIDVLEDLF